MKYLMVMAMTILLSACEGQGPQPYVQAEFTKTYKTFGTFTDKRIILTHGIWGNDTQYDSGGLLDLRNRLVANGFQVVTFSYPYTDYRIMADGGVLYRAQYKAFLEWMVSDLNAKYGTASELDIGGFSFGGLHAMMGIALLPDQFSKYVAMVPVSDPGLSGLFGSYQGEDFSAFNEVATLQKHAGIITTGQLDTILGYANAERLCSQIGAQACTLDHINDTGHAVNTQMVDDIMAWL